jgi:hypothetical protein
MAVSEGVLEIVQVRCPSEGTGGYAADRGVNITRFHATGVDPQGGWMQRQSVDIDGIRIKNVVARPDQDALLEAAVGGQVARTLTVPLVDSARRHVVVAIRRPSAGIDSPSGRLFFAASSRLVLKHWLTASFLLLFLLFLAWPASLLHSPLLSLAAWTASGVAVWWMVAPFVQRTTAVPAASALDKAPWISLARRS